MNEQQARLPFFFQGIFRWFMIFVGIYWVSVVALMMSCPWDKSGQWSPDLPLVAVCANQKPCGIVYGQLDELKAKGGLVSLTPPEANGDVQDGDIWTKWTNVSGAAWQYEVKRSSWHFEIRSRYRLEAGKPILVQSRSMDGQLLIIALPIAAFFVLGLRLRSLRGS